MRLGQAQDLVLSVGRFFKPAVDCGSTVLGRFGKPAYVALLWLGQSQGLVPQVRADCRLAQIATVKLQ